MKLKYIFQKDREDLKKIDKKCPRRNEVKIHHRLGINTLKHYQPLKMRL